MDRLAVVVDRIPDRERNAEEPLAADQPVAVETLHPVAVAVAHVVGVEAQLLAELQERRPKLGGAAAVADVPLPAGDDLQGPVALLVELDRVGDRARLAVQGPFRAELLDDDRLRLLGGLAGDRRIGRLALGRDPPGLGRRQPAVAADQRARRQVELSPPDDVGDVAERADHGDAGALLRIGQLVGDDGDLDPVEGSEDGAAEQRLESGVVGVGDERAAGRDQLGPRGLDVDRRRRRHGGRRSRDRRPASPCRSVPPGRPRCGSRCPTASGPRAGRPRRGPGCAGTPSDWCGRSRRRSSCTGSSSRTTGRGGGTAPRRRPRRRRPAACTARRSSVG